MVKFTKTIMALLIGLTFCLYAKARQPDGLEQQQLVLLVKNINSKVNEKDFSVLANSMPERLYKAMAVKMGTTQAALHASFERQLSAQFEMVIPNGYKLDYAHIDYKETSGDSIYALIPMRIETPNEVIQSTALAVYDNLRWNIVLGGQKTIQNPIFLEIYPMFQDVTIPIGQVTKK